MAYILHHKTDRIFSTGRYYPLGATLHEDGTNFAVYSRHAHEVFLLLFDKPDGEPTDIIRIENRTKYKKVCQRRGWTVKGPRLETDGLR